MLSFDSFLLSMNTFFSTFAVSVSLLCLSAATSQAAYTIVEDFSSSIVSGSSDVVTRGSLVYAYTGNSASLAVTVNGVDFTPIGGAVGSGEQVYGSISCRASSSSFGNATPAYVTAEAQAVINDADYASLLSRGLSVSGSQGDAVTLTLNDLQVGHTYLLQIWFNDNRTTRDNANSSIRFSDQLSGQAFVTKRNNGPANDRLGSYVTVAFTVDSDSQSFLLSEGNFVMFNALQVRDITPIPEPATLTLTGLALLGAGMRRRR